VIDNSGSGDLFTASKGGQTYFRADANSGTYLGNAYDGEFIVGKDGNGKITAGIVDPYLVANQKTSGITSLTFQTLGSSNADFIYKNQSTEIGRLSQLGQLSLPITGSDAGLVIGGDTQLFRGATDRLDLASGDSFNIVNGSLQIGGTTTIDSSGNATFNNITINGGCTGCGSVSPTNSPFQVAYGAISPLNSTLDFLIGGNATSSSKFAVLNVADGTPTASISANSGDNALFLTGDGTLATTNRQNLTIGGNDTGTVTIAGGDHIGPGNDYGAKIVLNNSNGGVGGDLSLAAGETGFGTGGNVTINAGLGNSFLDAGAVTIATQDTLSFTLGNNASSNFTGNIYG
ncbi:MAG TPA: hypothetical protein V6C65_38595, partial [Allocoleopsis sp.]